MKCICKQDYVQNSYQIFLSENTHEYDNIWHEGWQEYWYIVKNYDSKLILFSYLDFKDYFMSEKEVRKQKLIRLNIINNFL